MLQFFYEERIRKASIQIEEIWKLEKYDRGATCFTASSNARLKADKNPNYRTYFS